MDPTRGALTGLTTRELARLMARKDVSAREVVAAHLERVDAVRGLGAVVTLCDERALVEATRADDAVTRGETLGPLHGVPFTVKDAFETAGVRTTAGSPGLVEYVPDRDATAVARLRDAGAILLGKTNTAELTLRYETDNEVFGQTWNPRDPDRSPGGSSGGAAAAVGAHAVPFEVGTDTGGSIRLPAHFCGVAGLKPTQGRVPLTGLVSAGTPLDLLTVAGPLARSVEDLELVLRILDGPDGWDGGAVPMPLRPVPGTVGGLRVGYLPHNGVAAPTSAVAAAIEAARDTLASAGAHILPTDPGPLRDAGRLFVDFFTADGGAWLRRFVARLGAPDSDLAPPSPPEPPPATAWSELVERWLAFRTGMLRLLQDADVLLLPVHPEPAQPPHVLDRPDRLRGYSYAVAFNLAGWPALSVPAGTTPDGLPVGAQLCAAPGREDLVLGAGRLIEGTLASSRL